MTGGPWAAIDPPPPSGPPEPKGKRPRRDGRAVLAGMIFVLRSGIPWKRLPDGSGRAGMACRRRLAGGRGRGRPSPRA
ncbi:MAG: transposase, partial [Geminicoccaceae bacterium]|nr:transposase [Geminicoccaceae bacterium]